MKLALYIFLSFLMGIVFIISLIFAGFSGSIVFAGVTLFLLCVICFMFSLKASMKYPKFFWLFGICYILLPLFFALASGEGSKTDTMKMRLIWISILLLVYIASLAGGIRGKYILNKNKGLGRDIES